MDSSLRKNIADRDAALSRTRRVTRAIAALCAAASLVLMAGFAHLIPTDFPHSSQRGGGTSGGGSGTGNGNSNSGNNSSPSPTHGSGPSHATSGGS